MEQDQTVATIETDKASIDVRTPVGGKIVNVVSDAATERRIRSCAIES